MSLHCLLCCAGVTVIFVFSARKSFRQGSMFRVSRVLRAAGATAKKKTASKSTGKLEKSQKAALAKKLSKEQTWAKVRSRSRVRPSSPLQLQEQYKPMLVVPQFQHPKRVKIPP